MAKTQNSTLSRRGFLSAALMAVGGACATSKQDKKDLSPPTRPYSENALEEIEKGKPFLYKRPLGGGVVKVDPGDPDYDDLWPYRERE